MKTAKITGGRAGFALAIKEAFSANIHDPTIRYSHSLGFHVESGLVPADDDVIWSKLAYYVLPDGRPCIRPADYSEIRSEILGE